MTTSKYTAYNGGAPLTLDLLLEPFSEGSGVAAAATNFFDGGADLNTLYARLADGAAVPAATGLLVGSADLNTIFCALGSASGIDLALVDYSFGASGLTEARLVLYGDGSTVNTARQGGTVRDTVTSSWYDSTPTVDAFECHIVYVSGPAFNTNQAASFTPITAGGIQCSVAAVPAVPSISPTATTYDLTVRNIAHPSQTQTKRLTIRAVAT